MIQSLFFFFLFFAYVAHKKKSLICRIDGHNTSILISLCKIWFIHVANSSNLQLFFYPSPCVLMVKGFKAPLSPIHWEKLGGLLSSVFTYTPTLHCDCPMLISNLCLVSRSNRLWWERTSWEFQNYSAWEGDKAKQSKLKDCFQKHIEYCLLHPKMWEVKKIKATELSNWKFSNTKKKKNPPTPI